MTPAPTRPGTRKLSDVARHVVVPTGIVTTGYPAVRDKCADLGIVHDDWQQGLGRLILGKRADGKYAATVGGVVISIPRQVGKTFTVGTIIVALCLLFPGLTVLWTAHRTRTSNETFAAMKGMTSRRRVKPFMLDPRSVNGEQEIRFRNGSRILFGAREQGFGRGFAQVDIEVFDEAQILTERALEDMVAATNQARHPAGALLFYMGTPPRPADPGEAFRAKRQRALSGASSDMVYVELSADEGADPDDREQWAKANPSYPLRTPVESMLRLRENVGSDESFLREGLGIWDDEAGSGEIPVDVWSKALDPGSEPVNPTGVALSVAMSRDHLWTCIGLASERSDGDLHVEIIENRRGTGWVVDRLVDLAETWAPCAIVVDPAGPEGSLIADIEAADLEELVKPTARDAAQAFGMFYNAVVVSRASQAAVEDGDEPPRQLWHRTERLLDVAIPNAHAKTSANAKTWDQRGDVDISPLIAVTNALWGWLTHGGETAPTVW